MKEQEKFKMDAEAFRKHMINRAKAIDGVQKAYICENFAVLTFEWHYKLRQAVKAATELNTYYDYIVQTTSAPSYKHGASQVKGRFSHALVIINKGGFK